jgi:hypothetical protein
MTNSPEEVEFKIYDGIPWKLTPVYEIKEFYIIGQDYTKINLYARSLADQMGEQVRWNFKGSFQGHYIDSTTEEA